ncbi:hypothetical protein [Leptolyngbya sp. PCC 6406]|uniref:hypothetical protein n=1 Tax=Leptolyngbya sp. PCC 6406 TaxID=1173264 RepID=UPI0002AC6A92|nr:hypothetical protein [Leptolyngbya sp. PCC 6406]
MARKKKVSLSLTPAAVAVLDELATHTELSRSALVESLVQGQGTVMATEPQWAVRLVSDPAGMTVVERLPLDRALTIAPEILDAPESPRLVADTGKDIAIDSASETPEALTGESPVMVPASPDPEESPEALMGESPVMVPASPDPELLALRQQVADLQAQRLAAPSALAPPVVAVFAAPDPVPALQQQLLAAIATQSALRAEVQAQQQELTQLRQDLAHQQSLAAVGERQLNKWRHQTFSR